MPPGSSPPSALRPVTVIVPIAGRPEALVRSLDSLRRLSYPDFDVLAVDNRPTDPATRELVRETSRDDDRIRYLPESRPGSSVARNAVTVEPEWLDWLVEPLVTDPRVTVVTGLVLPAELETPAQRWFEVYGGFGKGFDRREYDLDTHRADDKVLDPFWGGGFGRATAWPSARARSRRSAASTRRSTLEAPRGAAPTSRPSAV